MTTERVMQLPAIRWAPRPAMKKAPAVAETAAKLEEMSLGELLFLAIAPAR